MNYVIPHLKGINMSRNGITPDEVAIAAQSLAAADKPVTVQTVREYLGTGSFTTIAQHLAQWRQQAKIVSTEAVSLPPEVEVAANKAIAAIWQSAMAIARREIEAIRQTSHVRIGEVKTQAEEACQEVARLEAHIERDQQQIREQLNAIDDLRRQLTHSEANIAAQVSRAEQLDGRIAELKAELAETRAIVEQKTDECGRLRGEIATLALASPFSNTRPFIELPSVTS
jgi:DNA repair exonuclease SbcCD ATPase subunit